MVSLAFKAVSKSTPLFRLDLLDETEGLGGLGDGALGIMVIGCCC